VTFALDRRQLVVADRWFPSSKTCCACGHVQDIGWDEHWQCEGCSITHQRDDNAAINLARWEDAATAVGPVGAAVKRGADRKTGPCPTKDLSLATVPRLLGLRLGQLLIEIRLQNGGLIGPTIRGGRLSARSRGSAKNDAGTPFGSVQSVRSAVCHGPIPGLRPAEPTATGLAASYGGP
jgi:Putative transposase DNA-binding domain